MRAGPVGGAAVLAVAAGLGEVVGAPGRHLWLETAQFSLICFGVSPLAVIGLAPVVPRRGVGRLERPTRQRPTRQGPIDQRGSSPLIRCAPALGAFVGVTVVWRLPVSVDALAHDPAWLPVEFATLLVGTWPLWRLVLEGAGLPGAGLAGAGLPGARLARARLAGASPAGPGEVQTVARPLRIAIAALAAWSVWVFAYAVGFSGRAFYAAYPMAGGSIGDQELAVGILWVASAAALAPTMFVNLVRWLEADRRVAELETGAHEALSAYPRAGDVGRC